MSCSKDDLLRIMRAKIKIQREGVTPSHTEI